MKKKKRLFDEGDKGEGEGGFVKKKKKKVV